jgi:Cobalamin-independent synthase, N-terminal domain
MQRTSDIILAIYGADRQILGRALLCSRPDRAKMATANRPSSHPFRHPRPLHTSDAETVAFCCATGATCRPHLLHHGAASHHFHDWCARSSCATECTAASVKTQCSHDRLVQRAMRQPCCTQAQHAVHLLAVIGLRAKGCSGFITCIATTRCSLCAGFPRIGPNREMKRALERYALLQAVMQPFVSYAQYQSLYVASAARGVNCSTADLPARSCCPSCACRIPCAPQCVHAHASGMHLPHLHTTPCCCPLVPLPLHIRQPPPLTQTQGTLAQLVERLVIFCQQAVVRIH